MAENGVYYGRDFQPEAACMTRGMSRIAKCIDNYGGLE